MSWKSFIVDFIRCMLSPVKRLVNRNCCIGLNKSVKVMYGVDLQNTKFDENAFIAHHASCVDVSIGRFSSVGRYSKIRLAEIGKYCSISWDTTIGAVEHPLDRISTCALTYKSEYSVVNKDKYYPQKKTIIGNDVWVGCNVVILSGVHVGDGAVIGSGAVVTKDVSPYSIVAGVPAKEIRKRIEPDLIPKMQELEWWNWDVEDIKNNVDLFEECITEKLIDRLLDYKRRRRI